MCDIRVAADDAVFALPRGTGGRLHRRRRGLRLANEIGAGNAKLLALTGRRIDAAKAERLGIVQEVTTRDELVPTAMAIATDIAANAPLAVQSIKRTIDAFAYRGLSEALKFEALSASVEFVSDDMPAGYAAKAKKQQAGIRGEVGRPPPWDCRTAAPAGSTFLPRDLRRAPSPSSRAGARASGAPSQYELARAGAAIASISRSEEHRSPGWRPWRRSGAASPTPEPTSARPIRSPTRSA